MDIQDFFINFYVLQNGEKFIPELAKLLVEDFAITDGTSNRLNGEKWSIEEAERIAVKMGITFEDFSKLDWYIVLNNEYSNKFQLVHKYKLPEPQIYYDFALAWFTDVDAKENKTFHYFIG